MTQRMIIGDAVEVLSTLEPASVDLAVGSPPFLAQRDYLDDEREIGNEESPGEYLQRLLHVTGHLGRVLRPDGSLCMELGDTFSGSGGAGGDYNEGGSREGQPRYKANRDTGERRKVGGGNRPGGHHNGGDGWPLGKSLCMIPHLYAACLAYGFNVLTGDPSPAGRWRVRNVICWARTNPTPGAHSDRFRVGTSYITVACRKAQRYFDHEAVGLPKPDGEGTVPPLDWMVEPGDGEFTWVLANTRGPRSPIAASEHDHPAIWPEELARRLILAMCPPGGTVLDPFVGSGTTLAAAQGVGRRGIGIDLDVRNAELAREKVGMFFEAQRFVSTAEGSGFQVLP